MTIFQFFSNLAYRILQQAKKTFAVNGKRNSELINSLLGVPKAMNDAGR